MTGEATNNLFGFSVSDAGDVNGDGFADVYVGAWAYSSSKGRAYLYYGGASMNDSVDIFMTGETSLKLFWLFSIRRWRCQWRWICGYDIGSLWI